MKRLTPASALANLSGVTGRQFIGVFRHGSLEVEIYKPVKIDLQTFQAGEVLFVPAGVEHRFENFTEDFVTWVFFYGPEGGEANNV